jgi:hypothetical protein
MTVQPKTQSGSRVLDKRMLSEVVAALQQRLGLPHDPTMTAEEAQAISIASGVRPEDRLISSEILRARAEKA